MILCYKNLTIITPLITILLLSGANNYYIIKGVVKYDL